MLPAPTYFSAIPKADSLVHPAVYGVVLNHACSLEGLGGAQGQRLAQPPYQAAPRGPVLYVKPRNTWVESGSAVALPPGETAVEIGATLALVVGDGAAVAAGQLVMDLSLPHDSYYRPAIREKCFDGSCVLGLTQAPLSALDSPFIRTLRIATLINGRQVDEWGMEELVRPPASLLAEVSAFMTLNPGDRLLLGVKWQAPQARIGDVVTVQAEGLRSVQCRIVPEQEHTRTSAHANIHPSGNSNSNPNGSGEQA